jgi:ABC-2 type transport system permease protein/lipopolysaccharide transport system permease protein
MVNSKLRVTIYDGQKKENLFGYLMKIFKEASIYRFTYFNFVSSNLSARYRRSALGFLWTLINPLVNLTILALIFSLIFKQDLRIFGVYVFSAMSPWFFISNSLVQSSYVFVGAESYLKKVYIPKFIFPLTLVTVEVINFFFSMLSIYIIFLCIGAKFSWVMLLTPLAMLITFVFILGIVMVLSVAQVYFRDIAHIVQVLMGALMYSVPIIYPLDLIPEPFKPLILFNPFFQFINLFRALIYDMRIPMWQEWLIPLGLALLSLLVGCLVLMKREDDLVFRL